MDKSTILEIAFVILGLLFVSNAVQVLRSTAKTRVGTAIFWLSLGTIFIFGAILPPFFVGCLLIVIAGMSMTKQVKMGTFPVVTDEQKKAGADKFKNLLFVPSIVLAFLAIGISLSVPSLGGQPALVIASLFAILIAIVLFKPKADEIYNGTSRLIQQMGVTIFLPQLLASVGAVFTAAKVGHIISTSVAGVVSAGDRLVGIIVYVFGMVIFTMIMGNAFAAFTVITAGIGVPFVFALGGNPLLIGTLAMTAGYCGTLMTPMAANFNGLPASLLEMKNPNGVIKIQAPIALTMIVLHIVIMYFFGF